MLYLTCTTTTANAALPKAGGTLTGNLNLQYAYPRINLTDTNHDSDYSIINNDGAFSIYDATNNSHRLSISSSGVTTFAGTVTVAQNILSASSAPLVLTGDGGANIELYGNGTAFIDATTTTFRGTNGSGSGNISAGTISSGTVTSTGIVKASTTFLATSGSMLFYVPNVGEAMQIQQNTGNVGIGANNPAYQVHIKKTGSAEIELEGTVSAELNLHDSGGSANTRRARLSMNGVDFKLSALNDADDAVTHEFIAMKTDTGNVGIGTTTPTTNLTVVQSGVMPTSGFQATQWVGAFVNTGATNSIARVGIYAGNASDALLNFGDSDDADIGGLSYSNAENSLAFRTNNAEHMRIKSDGKVGIGTTAPSTPLHARYSSSPSSGGNRNTVEDVLTLEATGYYPYGGYGMGINFQGEDYGNSSIRDYGKIQAVMRGHSDQNAAGDPSFSADLAFWTNTGGASSTVSTEKMRITSAGLIGIGTTGPNEGIHISKSGDASIRLQRTAVDQQLRIDQNSIRTTSNSDISIFTNGNASQLFLDQSSGNVGIGTSSPTSKLHISNAGAPADDLTLLTLENGNGTGDIGTPDTWIDFVFKDTNTNVTPQARIGAHAGDGGDANTQILEGKGYLTFHTSGTTATDGDLDPPERMRIDSSGRVGINRTPSISNSKLEVGGADNVSLINVEASGNTGGIGIGSTGLQFFHGSSSKLAIASSGAATFNGPSLHLVGTNSTISVGEGTGGGTFGFMGWNDASNYLYLGHSYNSTFNKDLVINSSGNVGIGTNCSRR